MEKYYTDEKNVQILIALLKEHGIRKAILSPGSSNSPLVASLQYDNYFETYSCVDERSAAYMACGMAEQSGEAVILSCTGATASRNYLPGMTEAFYRRLPVLAITSTQPIFKVGHHVAQVVDRSSQPNDTYTFSTCVPVVKDSQDFYECEIKINQAILQLRNSNGGSTHINLETNSLSSYTTKELPKVRVIRKFTILDTLPTINFNKISIFVGAHSVFSIDEIRIIENFCMSNNAVVFCDHTSNYNGNFKINASVIGCQQAIDLEYFRPDLTIHIGEISGDYYGSRLVSKNVWRVNRDGLVRDTFGYLTNVFEMDESLFFRHYIHESKNNTSYFDLLKKTVSSIYDNLPEFPFSNVFVASILSNLIPNNSILHLGILNSLRSWNLFEINKSVKVSSNVGGFGIDGIISSALGASLVNIRQLTFCIVGDLAFFYDLNSLGNRHVHPNLRILLINNGKGIEFQTYRHHTSHFGDVADKFICAAGHFGNQSKFLVKNFTQDLGFDYMSACDKETFLSNIDLFVNPVNSSRPIVFEIFTNSEDESKALELFMNINHDLIADVKSKLKDITKSVLGEKGISVLRKSLKF